MALVPCGARLSQLYSTSTSSSTNAPSFSSFSSSGVEVQDFLRAIGKGVEGHSEKMAKDAGSLPNVLRFRGRSFKGFGIPCQQVRVSSSLRIRCGKFSEKGVTSSQKNNKRNDWGDGWILDNAGAIRSAPLFVGGASLAAILLNRSISGIAAVADASSSQSRADVLAVALSAVVVLTGLVWKSIEPRPQFPVELDGVECLRVASGLPVEAARELNWAWSALAQATNTAALVVVYGKSCVLQCGTAAESRDGTPVLVDVDALLQGSLCRTVRTSSTQMYLANLALYPGRFELLFLPSNTQAVIIQPLGNDGIMIVASDTLRGFGPSDQGWIVAIGEKLDSTLADSMSSWDRDLVPDLESKENSIETMPSR